ncbi:MAG: glucosaminidase domain-containing protein [Alphaproteobacteria bacterium]|nr:glucosaminidase domain-containing protein [Alphaproteobacteria bacterium]
MKKICMILLLLSVGIKSVFAAPVITKADGALWVERATTAEAQDLFLQYGFEDYHQVRGKFPRIFFKHLPTDWLDVAENDAKHRTFIRILLPLILKINEEILAERKQIEDLKDTYFNNGKLNEKELALLEEKAEKYEVFTRLKGASRVKTLLRKTLENIDVLPPSIMIATAAIYTDWGKSRLAREANSLYLEELWYTTEGIVPADDPNGGYRYKAYDSLEDCIRARALRLNTHVNYDYLRASRLISRKIKRPPYGEQLAAQMLSDSNYQNIAGLIDYTFSFYKLNRTDYFPELRNVE